MHSLSKKLVYWLHPLCYMHTRYYRYAHCIVILLIFRFFWWLFVFSVVAAFIEYKATATELSTNKIADLVSELYCWSLGVCLYAIRFTLCIYYYHQIFTSIFLCTDASFLYLWSAEMKLKYNLILSLNKKKHVLHVCTICQYHNKIAVSYLVGHFVLRLRLFSVLSTIFRCKSKVLDRFYCFYCILPLEFMTDIQIKQRRQIHALSICFHLL